MKQACKPRSSMPGLIGIILLRKSMDCRIKPGNDERRSTHRNVGMAPLQLLYR